jgi:GNAT superfamily N-acetyltransferase
MAAAELTAQLGYSASAEDLRRRIADAASDGDRVLLGAELSGALVGWADASVERHLQGEDAVSLNGLVVGDGSRGLGVGRQLCMAVEDWTRAKGIAVLRVRSNAKRVEAHRFYRRDGYRDVKTSAVFEKRFG